jgi:hypothetical protein
MPRYSGTPTAVAVNGQTFVFPPRAIDDFPEAAAFLTGLLARGRLATHVAKTYVQLVARLRRAGRLADLSLLHNRVERTAANAYVRWQTETYDARLAPVLAALATRLPNKNAIRWLRVHALVAPFEGKTTTTRMPAAPDPARWKQVRAHVATDVAPMAVVRLTTNAWTLHVPEKPEPAHTDPCDTCYTIELTDKDLDVLGAAFESAWGHRDINKVPRDAFMFGEVLAAATDAVTKKRGERIAALAPDGVTGDELSRIGAAVARDVESFVARLNEGAEGIYLSKAACMGRVAEVLTAVGDAWGGVS